MSKSREHARTLLDKARGDRYVLEHLVDDPEAPLRDEVLSGRPTAENLDRFWAREVAGRALAWAEPLIGPDNGPTNDKGSA